MILSRWFRWFRCALIGHDVLPVLSDTRIDGICGLCGTETGGWDVTPKPLHFRKASDSAWNRLRWYQHLGLGFDRFMQHAASPRLRRVK